MQTKPNAWPVDADVIVLPDVQVSIDGSAWPPSDGVLPAGTASAPTWDVSRQLMGASLPGQIRGASGFSVAQSTVTIPQPETRLGDVEASRITRDGMAWLTATHDTPTSLRLGRFIVDSISPRMSWASSTGLTGK